MLIGRYFRLCYDKTFDAFRSMRAHRMEAKLMIKSYVLIRLIK
jgi:hypothetical protein